MLCMSGMLQLPAGQQLGYRGSCINFVNDLASVVTQLPRAPSDVPILIYRMRGKKGTHKDMEVRKLAVRDYLRFFSRHHHFFKYGI
mmetsp:Transcript_29380/g.63156  ORF Transcript_29380/g.63156 Transcript_29380/m.63156 type:complete len:86 (-) Transcript_29380:830-1087(-)